MQFQVNWVDISKYLASMTQPVIDVDAAALISRDQSGGSVGEFWTPIDPLLTDEPTRYAVTRAGEVVRIPMQAYKTKFMALSDLFGLGVQLGMSAIAGLRNYESNLPRTSYLIIGRDVTDLRPTEDSFRVYIGMSFKTK